MDWSILLLQLVRAAIIVILGLVIIKYCHRLLSKVAPLHGRINRIQFLWRYLLLTIIMLTFYGFIDNAIQNVVVLPSYWFLRVLLFIGTTFSIPFFISVIARRLQDLSLPGYYAIPWVYFLVFAPAYGVLSTTKLTFNLIIIIGALLLLLIPGVPYSNKYGPVPATTKLIRSTKFHASNKHPKIAKKTKIKSKRKV